MINTFNNNFVNIIKKIYKDVYNFSDELHVFHDVINSQQFTDETRQEILAIKLLGQNDRESIFYKNYHEFIDSSNTFNNAYFQFVNDYIKPLFSDGSPIVIQKTPNIRISFPNSAAIGKFEQENGDVIGLHKDSDFGHHSDEINIVIPITKMFDTNSIYYEPTPDSNMSTDNYINLNLKTNEFFIGNFNKLLHYNRLNNTGSTRISLDFRIIRYNDYMRNLKSFENTKFEIGKYYIII